MKRTFRQNEKGITLIALVITIIVLLILAGVSITMLTGENGILKNAASAKINTSIAEIEEAAKLAYVNRAGKMYTENRGEPTLSDIVEDLNSQGYNIETVGISGDVVTGVKLSQKEVSVEKGGTTTITVELKTEAGENGNLYFAKVNGKYYQINMNNENITVSKDATDISNITGGSGSTTTIDVSIDDTSIATATINDKTITITGVENGTTNINVEVNGITTVATISSIELTQNATEIYVGDNKITTLDLDGAFLLSAVSSAVSTDAVGGASTEINSQYIWTTSNPDVATVTSDGIVIPGTKTTAEGGKATITCKGSGGTSASVEVTSTAKIVYTNEGSTNTTVTGEVASTAGNGENIPYIPAGYSAVTTAEGVWNTETSTQDTSNGLVIMDSRGNQFVWVPVNDTTLATLVGTNTSGYQLYGTSETTSKTQKYTLNTTIDGKTFSRTTPGTTSSYREPDLVSDDYNTTKEYYKLINSSYTSGEDLAELFVTEYNNMTTQVGIYKGFYVGRYEVSYDARLGKIASIAGSTSETASASHNSTTRCSMWYGLYRELANFATSSDTFKSQMIFGCQYDAMLLWMASHDVDVNTKLTSGYNNTRITGNPSISADKWLNIYDLDGNSLEWTQEANNTGNRVYRGGNYYNRYSPSNRYSNNPSSTFGSYGSRLTLYIR